jgi:hypothetical protein
MEEKRDASMLSKAREIQLKIKQYHNYLTSDY